MPSNLSYICDKYGCFLARKASLKRTIKHDILKKNKDKLV